MKALSILVLCQMLRTPFPLCPFLFKNSSTVYTTFFPCVNTSVYFCVCQSFHLYSSAQFICTISSLVFMLCKFLLYRQARYYLSRQPAMTKPQIYLTKFSMILKKPTPWKASAVKRGSKLNDRFILYSDAA